MTNRLKLKDESRNIKRLKDEMSEVRKKLKGQLGKHTMKYKTEI